MKLIKNLLTNKTSKFLYLILFFVCIFRFPSILFLFLAVTVIVMMFAAVNKESKKQESNQEKNKGKKYTDPDREELKNISEELQELDVDKDFSKLKNITERIPSLMEDITTPKTFYEIVGDLILKTTHYYFEDLDKPDKNSKKYPSLESDFQKAKDVCDNFFDGNEYVKVWVIYRSLLQRQVPEEKINKNFPELISTLKDIRDQKWKDVAWAYHIADEVEKVTGKDSCTKKRYKTLAAHFDEDDTKERMTEKQNDEFKNDYKLLLAFDPEAIKEKEQEISENFLKSFDVSNFKGKPKKIKSKIKWKLEDAIEFAKIIQSEYSEVSKLSAFGEFGEVDELTRKSYQYAGFVRSEEYYESLHGEKFLDQIQDLERISDFYQFEMFDEDPIQSAIENEDIERIMFYSLIQIPRYTISKIEEVSKDDPIKRAPYFSIMYEHMTIILNILERLEIFNNDEIVIKSWIFNQITDPLDKGKSQISLSKKNKKGRPYDRKYIKELWLPLYRFIDLQLSHPDGLVGDVEKVYEIIGPISINVLYNYFAGDPEQAYAAMKPMLDLMKEQEKNSESKE